MKFAIAAVAFFMCGLAQAQWSREPDSVLGIKLGQPLSSQNLPTCPPRAYEAPSPCIETKAHPLPGYPAIHSLGGHPFGYAAMTLIISDSGIVSAIRTHLTPNRFDEFKTVLVERYGPPSRVEQGIVQNGMGATFSSQTLEWRGTRMSITAIERGARLNESWVYFSDNAYLAQQAEELKNQIKGAASKL